MFIKDSDLIEIKIYYKKKGNRYTAYTKMDFDAIVLKEDEKKDYSVLSLKMQELTWGLYNQLQEDAMVENANGNSQFNVKVYKENRLFKLLREWDAVSAEGKPIPITMVNVSHLSPAIAEIILRAYDEISLISEDEEGK